MISSVFDNLSREIKEDYELALRFVNLMKSYTFRSEDYGKLKQLFLKILKTMTIHYRISETNEVVQIIGYCLDIVGQLESGIRAGLDSDKLSEYLADFAQRFKEAFDIVDVRCCAVTMVKNESENLEEWICYHMLVGIERFFIYDNESDDNTRDILKPYIDKGIVTIIDWPGQGIRRQFEAFTHAVMHFCNEAEYMAVIDPDEFLLPTEYGKLVPDIVDEIIEDYRNKEFRGMTECGGVGFNWMVFGTGFHEKRPDALVTESYLYHSEHDYQQNCHIKTIFNPRVAIGFSTSPHAVDYLPGYTSISEKCSYLFNSPFFYDASYEKLRVNHYYYKSREEFTEKFRRNMKGFGDPDLDVQIESTSLYQKRFSEADEVCNRIYDESMLAYTERIKEKIQQMRNV